MTNQKDIEVLFFVNGDEVATIVTDGTVTRSYTRNGCQAHRTVIRAVAHLEAKGYQVLTDKWL